MESPGGRGQDPVGLAGALRPQRMLSLCTRTELVLVMAFSREQEHLHGNFL